MITIVLVATALLCASCAIYYRRKYLITYGNYSEALAAWEDNINQRAQLDAKVLASLRAVCDSHKAPIKHPVECLNEDEISQLATNFYASTVMH